MSTSVSSSQATHRGARTRRAVFMVCSLLCTLLVAAIVIVQGSVSGTEFAPSHFQEREFSFYEIPFLHLQITPVRRKLTTGDTARQIRTSAWINAPRGKKPSLWHLVSLSRGPITTPALASLLTEELAIAGPAGPYWKAWNKNHPQQAAVLWPVTQRLANREMYVLIPGLLELARTLPGDDDANALTEAIDAWLVEQYASLIKDMNDAQRPELAQDLLAEALSDFPDSAVLQSIPATDD